MISTQARDEPLEQPGRLPRRLEFSGRFELARVLEQFENLFELPLRLSEATCQLGGRRILIGDLRVSINVEAVSRHELEVCRRIPLHDVLEIDAQHSRTCPPGR